MVCTSVLTISYEFRIISTVIACFGALTALTTRLKPEINLFLFHSGAVTKGMKRLTRIGMNNNVRPCKLSWNVIRAVYVDEIKTFCLSHKKQCRKWHSFKIIHLMWSKWRKKKRAHSSIRAVALHTKWHMGKLSFFCVFILFGSLCSAVFNVRRKFIIKTNYGKCWKCFNLIKIIPQRKTQWQNTFY